MHLSVFVAVGVGLALSACAYPKPDLVIERPEDCEVEGQPQPSDLLFVTERMSCNNRRGAGTERGSSLMYGAISSDRTLHFYDERNWQAALETRLEGGKRSPLLFIHGFNNTNDDALSTAFAIRTAVGRANEVIALTWPSYGHVSKYWWDEANVDWATTNTKTVISRLSKYGSGLTILAHSMGNRIALGAVERLPRETLGASIKRFIMASPDVDRGEAIADVPNLDIPVTIYGSTRDQPLSGSWVAHGLPRAGDLSTSRHGHKEDPKAISNSRWVDVIDTSRVTLETFSLLHHSDFIATPEGAADLCRVTSGSSDEDPKRGREFDAADNRWILVTRRERALEDDCAVNGSQASAEMRKKL